MKTHFSDTKTNFSRRMLSTLRFMAAPVAFYVTIARDLGRSDYRNEDDSVRLVVINHRAKLFYQILLALSIPLGLIILCLTSVLGVIAAVAQALFFPLECLIAKYRDHFMPKQPAVETSDSRPESNLEALPPLAALQPQSGNPAQQTAYLEIPKPSVFEEIFRDTTVALRRPDPNVLLNRTTTWVQIH